MIYHLAYCITNKINGKYYFGMHSTKNPNDYYMGSGKKIKMAIKKYGIKNFEKKIIALFANRLDLKKYEETLITERELSDPLCYNMTLGGGGNSMYNKVFSEEHKNLISKSNKNKKHIISEEGRNNMLSGPLSRKGKTHNIISIEKISKSLLGHTVTEESKQKNREKHLGKSPGNKGKKFDKQLKKYI